VLAAGLLLGACWPAAAQTATGPSDPIADEDQPVMSRPRPDYDAKGIPAGGFRVYRQLRLAGIYDDNVRRTETAKQNDYEGVIAPALRVKSDWGRDMAEVYAGLTNINYARNTLLNLTDWDAGLDGRKDIGDGLSVYGGGSASYLHEGLFSANTVGFQAAPNRYFLYHGEINGAYQANRLGLSLGGNYDRYNFGNTPLIGGGTLNNMDRDYEELQGVGKASYDVAPGYSAFIRGSYDTRNFKVFLDRSGIHRDSHGYRVDGGMDFQVSHLVSGEVYVGYLNQQFTAPLKNVSGLDYSARLDWLISPLLTLHLEGARTLGQTTLGGASVEDDKSVTLGADYELLPNVLLQGHASYVDTSYPGIARHDESPDLGLGGKYLINENLSAELNYDYSYRATNLAGAKFKDNTVTLALHLQD
jgi:hypothetical protein